MELIPGGVNQNVDHLTYEGPLLASHLACLLNSFIRKSVKPLISLLSDDTNKLLDL